MNPRPDPPRKPLLPYGKSHLQNLMILVVKLSAVTAVGGVLFVAVPAALDRVFGLHPLLPSIVVGAAWLIGFGLTLWNFPGAREYNENV